MLTGAIGRAVSTSILARACPRVISVSPAVDWAPAIASLAILKARSRLMPLAPRFDWKRGEIDVEIKQSFGIVLEVKTIKHSEHQPK